MSFPPIYLAKTFKGLAESGYRDSDLFDKMIDKLVNNQEGKGTDMEQGFKVYDGFINSENFKRHIATLLAWKIPKTGGDIDNLANALDKLV